MREVLRIEYGCPILRGRTPGPALRLLAPFPSDNPLDARSFTTHDPGAAQVLMVNCYVLHRSTNPRQWREPHVVSVGGAPIAATPGQRLTESKR